MGPTSLRPSKMEKGSLILSVELQLLLTGMLTLRKSLKQLPMRLQLLHILKLWIRTQTLINPVHVERLQMHTSKNFKVETCSKDHYTWNHHQEDITIRCIHFPPIICLQYSH